jgi:hypothetical protein
MTGDAPTSSGKPVLIPKHLRMEWMDALALDPELSPVAYKVAAVIGVHLNSEKGDTFVKQARIADLMQVSERTVWTAIMELERRGYLIVERRDLGTTTRRERTGKSTTVRNAGGKGVANTYRPAFQSSQLAATTTGRKLAAQCELWLAQSSQNPAAKVAASCEPTHKDFNPEVGLASLAVRARPGADLIFAAVRRQKNLGRVTSGRPDGARQWNAKIETFDRVVP